MEAPSIVPMVIFVVAVSVFIICCCLVNRFMRHVEHLHSRTTFTTHHAQYSHHQPVANNLQPVYGGHPILTGPCQQTYVPGPPPTYQEAAGSCPAPYSQAAYDGCQIMYPLQALVQPALPTDYTSPQAPYNPAYVESTNTS